MKHVLLFLTINFFCISCIPQLYVRKKVQGYDGKPTGLSAMLDINGYYDVVYMGLASDPERNGGPYKQYSTKVIFYEDGIIGYQFSSITYYGINKGRNNTSDRLSEISANPKGMEARSFYIAANWGRYEISNDTIAAYVVTGHTLNSAGGSLYLFKIIDRNTIMQILSENIASKKDAEYYAEQREKARKFPTAFVGKFNPLDTIPTSDCCWLKKKKWFWR